MPKRNKVAVIGWDSASLDILAPMLEKGQLPHLAKLMESGHAAILNSTIQPITPTAWTSFMTGVNPGKHGVYDFASVSDKGEFGVNVGANVGYRTLWSHLSEHDVKVGVVNVPMTFPPEKVNGVLISGMDAPNLGRAHTYPKEFAAKLADRFSFAYKNLVATQSKQPMEAAAFEQVYVDNLIEMTRQRGEVSRFVISEVDPDFFMVVFVAPDRVQHAFGSLLAGEVSVEDPIGQVYQACDDELGLISAELGPDTTYYIMSDHGACAYSTVFELNSWLIENGSLHINKVSQWDSVSETARKAIRVLSRRLNIPLKDRPGLMSFRNRIKWQKSVAFSMGAFGNIFINTQARFADGIVSDAEYDAVCDDIISKLMALEHNGKRVVKRVHKRRDIYSGAFFESAPDLLVETDYDFFVRNNLDQETGQIFYDAGKYAGRQLNHTGRHTNEGMVVAAGPDFASDKRMAAANIIDLTPTILAQFNVPIPDDMDGTLLPILNDAIADSAQRSHGTAQSLNGADADYTDEDREALIKHLRGLGYLD